MVTSSCYRHTYPHRVAVDSCCRCGRPLCRDCGVDAPVGRHCPDCAPKSSDPAAGPRRSFQQSRPTLLVKVLIGINVFVYLLQQNDPLLAARFGSLPLLVAFRSEYYRLITAAFLHANLFHLLFNMGALLIFGSQVERLVGRARFLVVYLMAAVGGSVCSMVFQPTVSLGVGASGALFGVLGAYLAVARTHRLEVRPILTIIGINLGYGFIEPAIDNWAHLGGLAVGLLLGLALVAADRLKPPVRHAAQAAAVLAVSAVMVLVLDARVQEIRRHPPFVDARAVTGAGAALPLPSTKR